MHDRMYYIIRHMLEDVACENGIKILFAIENGSRSWGMASKDSDYDVRFVYFRPAKDYFVLSPDKDVINIAYDENFKKCSAQGSLVDICGFDIVKYLKLLLSSNPTTIEWLNSPIVYYGNNNLPLRDYMKENFSPERLFHHYFSLFKNNYKEFIQQGKAITYKKYLYSMRGLLNAKYISEFDKIPPLILKQTVKEMKPLLPSDVCKKINQVIKIKSQGLERETILRIPEFDKFFDAEIKKEHKNFEKRKPDVEVFNDFLQKQILSLRELNRDTPWQYFQENSKNTWNSHSISNAEKGKPYFEELIEKSTPVKSKKFKISALSCFYSDIEYLFETDYGKSGLWVAESVNSPVSIYNLLEALICSDEKEFYFYCEEEGPDTFLYIEKIDDKNIRFVHLSPRIQLQNYIQTDEYKICQDVIVSKTKFIRMFYKAVINAVKNVDEKEIEIEAEWMESSFEQLKEGSEIVEKYLGLCEQTK